MMFQSSSVVAAFMMTVHGLMEAAEVIGQCEEGASALQRPALDQFITREDSGSDNFGAPQDVDAGGRARNALQQRDQSIHTQQAKWNDTVPQEILALEREVQYYISEDVLAPKLGNALQHLNQTLLSCATLGLANCSRKVKHDPAIALVETEVLLEVELAEKTKVYPILAQMVAQHRNLSEDPRRSLLSQRSRLSQRQRTGSLEEAMLGKVAPFKGGRLDSFKGMDCQLGWRHKCEGWCRSGFDSEIVGSKQQWRQGYETVCNEVPTQADCKAGGCHGQTCCAVQFPGAGNCQNYVSNKHNDEKSCTQFFGEWCAENWFPTTDCKTQHTRAFCSRVTGGWTCKEGTPFCGWTTQHAKQHGGGSWTCKELFLNEWCEHSMNLTSSSTDCPNECLSLCGGDATVGTESFCTAGGVKPLTAELLNTTYKEFTCTYAGIQICSQASMLLGATVCAGGGVVSVWADNGAGGTCVEAQEGATFFGYSIDAGIGFGGAVIGVFGVVECPKALGWAGVTDIQGPLPTLDDVKAGGTGAMQSQASDVAKTSSSSIGSKGAGAESQMKAPKSTGIGPEFSISGLTTAKQWNGEVWNDGCDSLGVFVNPEPQVGVELTLGVGISVGAQIPMTGCGLTDLCDQYCRDQTLKSVSGEADWQKEYKFNIFHGQEEFSEGP